MQWNKEQLRGKNRDTCVIIRNNGPKTSDSEPLGNIFRLI